MSKQGVGIVMGRILVDKKFREVFKKRPQAAFEGYELTNEERHAMAGMDMNALDKLAESLDKRLQSWYVSWAIHS